MRTFWIVIKLELFFIWRNWATWLIALAMLGLGAVAADNDLSQPWQIWGQLTTVGGLFLALILTFSTGNQINRDRERRLDGVIFSTPATTVVYVLAKYSAALLSLFVLTCFSLLAAILTDEVFRVPLPFLSPVVYPAFGPQVYLLGWIWLCLVPVIFGATFMFACTTLTRGKRVIAYIATLLIWLVPIFFGYPTTNRFFDISSTSFRPDPDLAGNYWWQHLPGGPAAVPSAQFIQHIMPLARAEVPAASIVSDLLVNRLFFLGVSVVLLCLTIYGVQRIRRSA